MRIRLNATALGIGALLALQAQAPIPPAAADPAQPGVPVKVAEHRSKWEYPKEVVVPAGSQLHLVQTGDTLWDLGNKYLGNPFAWPQIWDQNKWIKDPHWIYPGDPLIIPVAKQAIAQPGSQEDLSTPEVAQLQPEQRMAPSKALLTEYAFTFQDFLQLPFLAPKGAEAHFKSVGALRIAGNMNPERQFLNEGETIYLDGGSSRGSKVGDRLVILKVVKKSLIHPDDVRSTKPMGDVLQHSGVVRVIQVDAKGAVALIERAMDGIEVGDRVAPFDEPASMALKLRTDIKEPIEIKQPARIIYAKDNNTYLGIGALVLIDKGTSQGFKTGDVLLAGSPRTWEVPGSGKDRKPTTLKTNHYLGQLMVVRTGEGSATCRVLRAQSEMQVGNIVTR